MTRQITFSEALREAMTEEMRRDPSVYLMGEDVGVFGGVFGVSAGLYEEFGETLRVGGDPIASRQRDAVTHHQTGDLAFHAVGAIQRRCTPQAAGAEARLRPHDATLPIGARSTGGAFSSRHLATGTGRERPVTARGRCAPARTLAASAGKPRGRRRHMGGPGP